MATASTTDGFRIAYVLDERMLREAVAIVDEAGGGSHKARVDVTTDKGYVHDLSLDEVLALPNGAGDRIRSLRLTTPYGAQPEMNISFDDSRRSNSIRYSVTGSTNDVFAYSGRIEALAGRLRCWYSPLARADFLSALLAVYGVVLSIAVVVAFVVVIRRPATPRSSTSRDDAIGQAIVYGPMAALALLGAFANRLCRWLFPVAVFAIGDNVSVPATLGNWRWFVGGTVVVGFVISLAAGLPLR